LEEHYSRALLKEGFMKILHIERCVQSAACWFDGPTFTLAVN